jgi:hypothetical protein
MPTALSYAPSALLVPREAFGVLFRHAKYVSWNERVAQVLTFMARANPAPQPVLVHGPMERRLAEAAPIIKGLVS